MSIEQQVSMTCPGMYFKRGRHLQQGCGVEIILFGFGSAEPQIQIAAPAPRSVSKDTLKIAFLDFTNMIKVATIYKNFFSNHDFFYKIYEVSVKYKGAGAGAAIRRVLSFLSRVLSFLQDSHPSSSAQLPPPLNSMIERGQGRG
jgi:hypothetical protein